MHFHLITYRWLSMARTSISRSSWSLEVWSRPRFFSLYYKVNLLLISRTPDLLKLLISRSKYTVPLCVINENLLLITRSVAWLTPSRLKGWRHGINYLYNGIFVHVALLGFAGQLHRLTIKPLLLPDIGDLESCLDYWQRDFNYETWECQSCTMGST